MQVNIDVQCQICDQNWPVLHCVTFSYFFIFPRILQRASRPQAANRVTNSWPAVCEPHRLQPPTSTALCGSSSKPGRKCQLRAKKNAKCIEKVCCLRVVKMCCLLCLTYMNHMNNTIIVIHRHKALDTSSNETNLIGAKWKCADNHKSLPWQEPAWLAPGWFTRNSNASSCKWRTAKWMQVSPDASK